MNKYFRQPDVIIDLHGYTTNEASAVLSGLVQTGVARARVITGKGDLRHGPVLRSFVEQWLKNREVRFERAKISEGGDGALEVFLTSKGRPVRR